MAHLTYSNRQMIEKMLLYEKNYEDIGKSLRKDPSVILREVKRHKGYLPYSADRAQLAYEKALKGKRKKKLDQYPALKAYCVEKLIKEDWSPDEISQRLLLYEQRNVGATISHETIYQFIYSTEGRYLKLAPHLRTGRGKRRQWGGRSGKGVRIPDRISIHARPSGVALRKEIGHWESDLMVFPGTTQSLSVDVERTTRFTAIHKVVDRTAKAKKEAQYKTIDEVGETNFKSWTYDNGPETVLHFELREDFGIETYHCDPYASWQKGTVENTNKLLRQYFPRDKGFGNIPEAFIQEVAAKLNNRPRKCLNYLTPSEVLLKAAFNA